jgi:fatty-acid desaturase
MSATKQLKILCFILTLFSLLYFNVTLFAIAFIVGWILSGFVGVLYHRKVSHRAFEYKNKFAEYICYVIMILTGQGSPLGWAAVHRIHHAKTDTLEDPQSPHSVGRIKTFTSWYKLQDFDSNIVSDISKDSKLIFLHNYYNRLFLIYIVLLLAINPVWCLYFAGVSVTVCAMFVGIVNTFGHDDYTNASGTMACNMPLSFLYWGEGYHKTHHLNPRLTNLGNIDLGYYLIKIIAG